MKTYKMIQISMTIGLACLLGCDSSSTTDGRPNRGGGVTSDATSDQQRGGKPSDWSKGTGMPGSAPSHQPEQEQNQ